MLALVGSTDTRHTLSETGTQVEIGKRYGIHHRLGARKIGADLSQSVLIADDRQVPHRGGEKCS